MNITELVEAMPAGPINTGKLNRAANIIMGCTLITGRSVNGGRGGRRYSDQALCQIAAMAEGLPAFVNHVKPEEAFKPRDVKDLIGRHQNVRYDAATGRVISDLHLLEHQAPWVFSLAERMGDQIGNSLVSKGLVKMEGDCEVVDSIVALRSGDLVSDPASTRGLFEAVLAEARQHTEPVDSLYDRIIAAFCPGVRPSIQRADAVQLDEAWALVIERLRGRPVDLSEAHALVRERWGR